MDNPRYSVHNPNGFGFRITEVNKNYNTPNPTIQNFEASSISEEYRTHLESYFSPIFGYQQKESHKELLQFYRKFCSKIKNTTH